MKFLDKFKDSKISSNLIKSIKDYKGKPLNLMEFCGTHTHNIFKYGIRQLLPENIKMHSGPGCPVCVTDDRDINLYLSLSEINNVIITTFGDLLKVPTSSGKSLQKAKAEGTDIRMVYSTLDALMIARNNKDRPVIFLGIGFETTIPTVSAAILQAKKEGIKNFFVFCMHKLTPPATKAILNLGEIKLHGILGPGHVSTIIGVKAWEFLTRDYKVPFAIAGFEPYDILLGISKLIDQCNEENPVITNTYTRSVSLEGNITAISMINEVFEVSSAFWRGFGEIPESGLIIKEKYSGYDAFKVFQPKIPDTELKKLSCSCGEVLRGIITPTQCPQFNRVCTPENPLGPCMVSSEGTCSAYYYYGDSNSFNLSYKGV